MTIEELKKAYKDGKTIQFNIGGDEWIDWNNPMFDDDAENYRIKTEDCDNASTRYADKI